MSKHLLIVEDNPYDLELARAALDLSDVCCEVSVAQDGQEALDLLRCGDPLPDLVLLDLNMPRVNGHQVLAAVKADPALREVAVVQAVPQKIPRIISGHERIKAPASLPTAARRMTGTGWP